jgi:hypothetical protein
MAKRTKRKMKSRARAHKKHVKTKRARRIGRSRKVGYGARLRRAKKSRAK